MLHLSQNSFGTPLEGASNFRSKIHSPWIYTSDNLRPAKRGKGQGGKLSSALSLMGAPSAMKRFLGDFKAHNDGFNYNSITIVF